MKPLNPIWSTVNLNELLMDPIDPILNPNERYLGLYFVVSRP